MRGLDFHMNFELHAGLFPQPVLFIHGNLASSRWWQPVLEVFKARTRNSQSAPALTADWRGCGKTEAPASLSDLNPAKLAYDHITLVETLGLKKLHLVGHSLGGLISLMAAHLRPDLFDRLLLIDPVGADGLEVSQEKFAAFRAMKENRRLCELVLATTVHEVDVKDRYFQTLIDDAFAVADLNWEGIPKILTEIRFHRHLGEIWNDVLVVHGEKDLTLDIEESKKIAQALPHGRFRPLPHQGHSLNIENPVFLADLMTDFFGF